MKKNRVPISMTNFTLLSRFKNYIVNTFQYKILRFYKNNKIIDAIVKTQKETDCLLRANEMFMVYSIANARKKLPGNMAEVGVYQGASAKMICEAKGNRKLFLFDTFKGLPLPQKFENKVFKEKEFRTDLDSVKKYLSKYKNIFLCPGTFPESAHAIKDLIFSFVHLDVDLYKSTLNCLNFFYTRMRKGGIILSHDYSSAQGVKKAFDEFFIEKKENIIELPESQCMIVKL